jgi:hypothetical protein
MIGAQSRGAPVVASHCTATGQAAASGDAQERPPMHAFHIRPAYAPLADYSLQWELQHDRDPDELGSEVQAAGGGKTVWPHRRNETYSLCPLLSVVVASLLCP